MSQGSTAEEAVANLKKATELDLEEFGPTAFSRPFVTTFDVAISAWASAALRPGGYKGMERLGFAQVRQRGSHVVLRKELPNGPIGCVIPLHDELAVGDKLVQVRTPGSGHR